MNATLLASVTLLLTASACTTAVQEERPAPTLTPRPWPPLSYVCYRVPAAAGPIAIDGKLDDAAWDAAEWTAGFVDIEGDRRPLPRWKTRAKMLWDDTFFYIAAELEEPNVWATLTKRDSVIFHDNDFEVFLDPDDDTHRYGEFEINAFGTEWDLFLERPYRDQVHVRNDWDIEGLRTAVHVDGTLNDPTDLDRGWSVEMAFPWRGLAETRDGVTAAPEPGDRWRVNFSRVQWFVDYPEGPQGPVVRRNHPETGQRLPEDNWVWSPQGEINMHAPEMWGFVQFSKHDAGTTSEAFRPDVADDARFALRQIYYAQRAYRARYGEFAKTLAELGLDERLGVLSAWERLPPPPRMSVNDKTYRIEWRLEDGRELQLNERGRITLTSGEASAAR